MVKKKKTKVIQKKYEYPNTELDIITILDLLEILKYIDIAPVELQRLEVATAEWKRKFITSIIRGRHFGIITISYQENKYTINWKGMDKECEFKNLNGHQRLVLVLEAEFGSLKILEDTFIVNQDTDKLVNLGGMTIPEIKGKYPSIYKEKWLLRQGVTDTIGNVKHFCTPREESEIFKELNDNNNMNDQEKRQASSMTIANDIRNKCRIKPNDLYSHLGYSNKRMAMDKNRLRQMHFLINGVNKGTSKTNLDAIYDKSEFEYEKNKLEIESTLKGGYIFLGEEQDKIEKMMAEILKDDYYKEGIDESWHNSLWFYCFLILDMGNVMYDIDIVKEQFFKGHVNLILPSTEEIELGMKNSLFREALGKIDQLDSIKKVVNGWRKELRLDGK